MNLDATLLGDLSDDPDITAIADRLKTQVAKIEFDLKLLLLKMEEPRPVTLTVGDLLQLWRMKLKPLSLGAGSMIWPEAGGETPITLDTRLTIQALCDITLRAWDLHPGVSLEVKLHKEPERVRLDLILPPQRIPLAADFLEEMAAVLAVGSLQLDSAWEPDGERWVITLAIPLGGTLEC